MSVLEAITGTLPLKAQPYAKTYAAVLMTLLTTITVLTDAPDWLQIATALVTAPVVFGVPNLDPLAIKQQESVQPPNQPGGDVGLS